MKLKALALSAIAAVSTIIAPAPSEAYEIDYGCTTIRGWGVCVSYQDRNSDDILYIRGPKGEDRMSISCYKDGSYKWNSYGYNNKQFLDYLAQGYCFD